MSSSVWIRSGSSSPPSGGLTMFCFSPAANRTPASWHSSSNEDSLSPCASQPGPDVLGPVRRGTPRAPPSGTPAPAASPPPRPHPSQARSRHGVGPFRRGRRPRGWSPRASRTGRCRPARCAGPANGRQAKCRQGGHVRGALRDVDGAFGIPPPRRHDDAELAAVNRLLLPRRLARHPRPHRRCRAVDHRENVPAPEVDPAARGTHSRARHAARAASGTPRARARAASRSGVSRSRALRFRQSAQACRGQWG